VIKFFFIFLSFFLITNCSFDTRSGIWTDDKDIDRENSKITVLFEKEKIINNEFNKDFIIQTPLKKLKKKNQYSSNDYGFYELKAKFTKQSKYKFSKINSFDNFDPDLTFDKDQLIFFDKTGSIIKFDNSSKILWKKNYYSKREKKNFPILDFSVSKKYLVVTDSLSKYYVLDLFSGEQLWSKSHNTTFNSEIKIDGNKVYVIDANNILLCFSLVDGSKLWEFNSDKELIKSQKKLSVVYDDKKIFFNNSKGDIYALDKKNGNLLWITNIRDADENSQSFLMKTSKIVLNDKKLFLSNNKNNIFSLDSNSGFINWKQNVNSDLKPIIVGNLILSISLDGYFFLIDKNSGNILRITDIFLNYSEKKRKKIIPTGFVVGVDEIYLSLNTGKILVINLANGRPIYQFSLGRDKISRPFVNDNFLYFVKNSEIVKLR
tara:strand:- start:2545 stop:3843 length:1299 start_codon:yes stop_codon:yes gene_type:complete